MTIVKVVFFSGSGNTKLLAKAVHQGASRKADSELMEIKGEMIQDGRFKDEEFLSRLDTADAIIFGSPTYMGMVSGQMKCFFDGTSQRWFQGAWNSKLAAGFTTSLGFSGDKQSTLSYMATFAFQHGMIWIGCDSPNEIFKGKSMKEATNRLSSNTGVMSQVDFGEEYSPTPGDLKTGDQLGERVATYAAKL